MQFDTLGFLVCWSSIFGMAIKRFRTSDVFERIHWRLSRFRAIEASYRDLFRTLLHQLMTAQICVHDLDLSALDEPSAELVEVK